MREVSPFYNRTSLETNGQKSRSYYMTNNNKYNNRISYKALILYCFINAYAYHFMWHVLNDWP